VRAARREEERVSLSRRDFLKVAGATGAAAAAASGGLARAARLFPSAPVRALPSPGASGIDHIVVICMENRSFDHFLGWVPGANGAQAGLSFPDDHGVMHDTHHLTDWQGCAFNDPDHGYAGGRTQLNGGACDGFRKGDNDDFALGYYTRADLEATAAIVDGYTIFDNYFCSFLGPTYPNRFYTHSAATDRTSNTSTTSTMPSIWDALKAANIPSRYYFSDLPFLALFGTKHIDLCRPVGEFFADAASGTLPAYTYLDPFFLGEGQGGSNDDHPHADIRRGQAFISEVINTLQASPKWANTVLVVTYDEWGGFYDHVAPPKLPDSFIPTPTEEHNTAGFRVPTYVVSPFARKGAVAHAQYDHASTLKMVEWRFGLSALTPRDAAANNLAEVLDFAAKPNLKPSPVPVVVDPGPHVCGGPAASQSAHGDNFWRELKESPLMRPWRSLAGSALR
jgi:phospholipase C